MIHGTGIEDRMGHEATTEQLAYEKALLAVYLLADRGRPLLRGGQRRDRPAVRPGRRRRQAATGLDVRSG